MHCDKCKIESNMFNHRMYTKHVHVHSSITQMMNNEDPLLMTYMAGPNYEIV